MSKINPKFPVLFRKRLKSKLEEYGWTQKDLADVMGCTPAYISHLTTGRKKPGLEAVAIVSNALDVDIGYFIYGKG